MKGITVILTANFQGVAIQVVSKSVSGVDAAQKAKAAMLTLWPDYLPSSPGQRGGQTYEEQPK